MQPGKSHDIPPPTHCPGMWALIHPLKGEFMSMNSLQMCLELTSLSFSTSFPFMFLSLLYFLSPPFHASQIVLKKKHRRFCHRSWVYFPFSCARDWTQDLIYASSVIYCWATSLASSGCCSTALSIFFSSICLSIYPDLIPTVCLGILPPDHFPSWSLFYNFPWLRASSKQGLTEISA